MPAAGPRVALTAAVRRLPVIGDAIRLWERAKPVASEEQVAQYHADGYMVFDPLLPPELLDRAVTDMKAHPDAAGTHHGTRVFNGWQTSRAVRAVALAPRVLRLLRQLYGRRPRPFQTLNFPIGTEQHVHSDIIHFDSDPTTYMCGVWVALEDIDLRNGPLVYYSGSHTLPVVRMEDVAPAAAPTTTRPTRPTSPGW